MKDEKIIELVPQIQEYLKNIPDQSFKNYVIGRASNDYNVSPGTDIYEKYIGLLEPRDTNDYSSGPFLQGDVSISGIAFSKLNNDIRIISFRNSIGNCYVMNYDTNPGMNIDYSNTIFLLQDNGNHFDLLLPNSSPFITYDQLIDAVKNETIMNKELEITDTDGNITKTSTLELFKNSPPPPTDQLLIASIVNNTIGINKLPRYSRTIATQLYNFALQNNDDYETFVITLKNAIGQGSSNGGQSQKTQSKTDKNGKVGFTPSTKVNNSPQPPPTGTGAATDIKPKRVLQLINLSSNNPTQEQLWKDFNKFGHLEYTDREDGKDYATITFTQEVYAQAALDDFDPKTYGPKVELKFNRMQPNAYTGPVVFKREPYKSGKDTGTKVRYVGIDTYGSPTNNPGGIANTMKKIAKT